MLSCAYHKAFACCSLLTEPHTSMSEEYTLSRSHRCRALGNPARCLWHLFHLLHSQLVDCCFKPFLGLPRLQFSWWRRHLGGECSCSQAFKDLLTILPSTCKILCHFLGPIMRMECCCLSIVQSSAFCVCTRKRVCPPLDRSTTEAVYERWHKCTHMHRHSIQTTPPTSTSSDRINQLLITTVGTCPCRRCRTLRSQRRRQRSLSAQSLLPTPHSR